MKVRAVYEKGDRVRFLGHLDVSRCIRLALRRAKWPLEMSQGFSPKPRISVYAPLPVGVAGMREYFDASLRGRPDVGALARALASSLPEGFALHELYPIGDGEAPFEEIVRASLYSVDVEGVKDRSRKACVEWVSQGAASIFRCSTSQRGEKGRPQAVCTRGRRTRGGRGGSRGLGHGHCPRQGTHGTPAMGAFLSGGVRFRCRSQRSHY